MQATHDESTNNICYPKQRQAMIAN